MLVCLPLHHQLILHLHLFSKLIVYSKQLIVFAFEAKCCFCILQVRVA